MLVVLPVLITVVQAAPGRGVGSQEGDHRERDSDAAPAHGGAVGARDARVRRARCRCGLVRRADAPARSADVAAAARRAAGRAAVRHELRVGDAGHVAEGLLGRGRDHHLLVLPDRVPARRRVVAGYGSGARGDGAVARARRVAHVLPRRAAAAAPGAAGRHAARRCSTRWSSSTRSWRSSSRRSRSNIYAQYQLGFSAAGAAALSLLSIVALRACSSSARSRLRGDANYTRISQGARRGSRALRARPSDARPCSRRLGCWSRSASGSRSGCWSTGSRRAASPPALRPGAGGAVVSDPDLGAARASPRRWSPCCSRCRSRSRRFGPGAGS